LRRMEQITGRPIRGVLAALGPTVVPVARTEDQDNLRALRRDRTSSVMGVVVRVTTSQKSALATHSLDSNIRPTLFTKKPRSRQITLPGWCWLVEVVNLTTPSSSFWSFSSYDQQEGVAT